MEEYSPDKEAVIMTRDQVRSFDSWAINTLGIPGVVLMENAGRSCAELIKNELKGVEYPKVCIFCGTGNNGGDGYVIARHLLNSGFRVSVVICGDKEKVKGDAKINLDILEGMGLSIERLDMSQADLAEKIKAYTDSADMIIDSLFGTGLKGQLSGQHQELIETINARGIPILAVDIPSGLDCDTGRPLGTAARAKYTVSFVAVKKGFTVSGAADFTGRVFIASIGIEPSAKFT